MPVDQRLPTVNSDDGTWGEILRQYLMKEHYNDDTNNSVNGGHQKITIRPGTTGAGTAPIKFSSGPKLSTAEDGAMEYDGSYYFLSSKPSGTVYRRRVAVFDETGGATGDTYYRDANGYLTKLGIGSTGDQLTVSGGAPAWSAAPKMALRPTIQTGTSYSAQPGDYIIAQPTSAQLQINLPSAPADGTVIAAALAPNATYTFKFNRGGSDLLTASGYTSWSVSVVHAVVYVTYNAASTRWEVVDYQSMAMNAASLYFPLSLANGGTGNTTGNAASATKLQTSRTINGVSFDGTANITIPSINWGGQASSTTASVGSGYVTTSGSLVTITLPSTFAIGDTIRVAGTGSGGWKIGQPAGDNIRFLDIATTTGTGGYLSSTTNYDAVELVGAVANTTWNVVSSVGNITVV